MLQPPVEGVHRARRLARLLDVRRLTSRLDQLQSVEVVLSEVVKKERKSSHLKSPLKHSTFALDTKLDPISIDWIWIQNQIWETGLGQFRIQIQSVRTGIDSLL